MNTSEILNSNINITQLCNPGYNILQDNNTHIDKATFCKEHNITFKPNTNPVPSNPKMKTFYMQPYLDRTTSFYGSYDPKIGLRTAGVLTTFLFLVIAYSVYKTKCKRDRWSSDDKQFIERYSKVLADKWSGKKQKVINREATFSKGGKPSLEETAKWIHSQPLQEVSLMNKWTIQDTMYSICLESLKATACPVCSLSDLSTNINQSNSILTPGDNSNNVSNPLTKSESNLNIDNLPNIPNGLPISHTSNCNNINFRPLMLKHTSLDDKVHTNMINTLKSFDNELLTTNKSGLLALTDNNHNSNTLYELSDLELDENTFHLKDKSTVGESSLDALCYSGSDPSGDILSPITLETCSENSSSDCSIIVHVLPDNQDGSKCDTSNTEKELNANLIVLKDQSQTDQKGEIYDITNKLQDSNDNMNVTCSRESNLQQDSCFNRAFDIKTERLHKKSDLENDLMPLGNSAYSMTKKTKDVIISMVDLNGVQGSEIKTETSTEC